MIGSPPPVVSADERQLSTALANLVANARDAMRGAGTVTISAELDGEAMAMIRVRDNGEGMAPDVLRHAAEPFFTTKPVGTGAGLGLSMVDGFAKQSGGNMTIDSVAGQGTTVCLHLPGRAAQA